jgi:predicted transposase/invertase (TIGR01784 family)
MMRIGSSLRTHLFRALFSFNAAAIESSSSTPSKISFQYYQYELHVRWSSTGTTNGGRTNGGVTIKSSHKAAVPLGGAPTSANDQTTVPLEKGPTEAVAFAAVPASDLLQKDVHDLKDPLRLSPVDQGNMLGDLIAVYPLGKYVHLPTDFGFKRVFGTESNKALLIDFLNSLLPAHHHIKHATFKSNENLVETLSDRMAFFDLNCQAENGEHFIVEVQKRVKQTFFEDRSVFYSTFPIQEQSQTEQWNYSYQLKPVYTVCILDFVFDKHETDPTFIHKVQLKNQRNHVFYDKLTFIYIELPKFTKSLEELETHLDKWLFLFHHLSSFRRCPSNLENGVFPQLFDAATIANFSPLEHEIYFNSLKNYRDYHNVMDTAHREGFQQGRQKRRQEGLKKGLKKGEKKGLKKGRQEERQALLLKMVPLLLNAGMTLEQIAEQFQVDLEDVIQANQQDPS